MDIRSSSESEGETLYSDLSSFDNSQIIDNTDSVSLEKNDATAVNVDTIVEDEDKTPAIVENEDKTPEISTENNTTVENEIIIENNNTAEAEKNGTQADMGLNQMPVRSPSKNNIETEPSKLQETSEEPTSSQEGMTTRRAAQGLNKQQL